MFRNYDHSFIETMINKTLKAWSLHSVSMIIKFLKRWSKQSWNDDHDVCTGYPQKSVITSILICRSSAIVSVSRLRINDQAKVISSLFTFNCCQISQTIKMTSIWVLRLKDCMIIRINGSMIMKDTMSCLPILYFIVPKVERRIYASIPHSVCTQP